MGAGAVHFTTTGISEVEKELIRKLFHGTRYVLSDALTAETSYLLTYKAMFTEKYVQAHKWGISCISTLWAYKSLNEKTLPQYRIGKYEGAFFSTTGITNEIFSNYFAQHGAVYSPTLSRATDFLVSEDKSRETPKTRYAVSNHIPILCADEVFYDDIHLLRRERVFDVGAPDKSRPREHLFNGLTFYLEGSGDLHRLIRKKIIEQGGNRVEILDGDVTHIVYVESLSADTLRLMQKMRRGGRHSGAPAVIRYQWILDCVDVGALLVQGSYVLEPAGKAAGERGRLESRPFANVVAYLSLGPEERIKAKNKVLALGGSVAVNMGSHVTHCIIGHREDLPSSLHAALLEEGNLRACTIDWIDQSICHMGRVKEDRFSVSRSRLSLVPGKGAEAGARGNPAKKRAVLRYMSGTLGSWVVQFTGLSDLLKKKAATVLAERGASVVDGPEYNAKCTHMIVGTANVSVKFLSSIANGIWVLEYRIVEELSLNREVSEREYELRGSGMYLEPGSQEGLLRRMVDAIPKWRARRSGTGKAAFAGWRVFLLCQSSEREKRVGQLIANGGGLIVDEPSGGERSYVFIDKETGLEGKYRGVPRIRMGDILHYLAKPSKVSKPEDNDDAARL